MNVLFLNHKIVNCGVYQYGKRLFEILEKDQIIRYIYREIDSEAEYRAVLQDISHFQYIIYNYHCSTMPWLNAYNIQRKAKNIGLPHESQHGFFDVVCELDPTCPESVNRFSIPRPIYENVVPCDASTKSVDYFIRYTKGHNVPIIGSFGFGFENKGFHKVVKMVNEQYDEAVIKFVIPIAHFDPNPHTVYTMKQLCMNENVKPGITLMITHEFFSNADILTFLRSNTINLFLYDTMYGRGISSAIDYALSVKKPIAISDSFMFRHIYSDDICLYKRSIEHCIQHSEKYLLPFCEKYSHAKMIACFRKIYGS